MSSCSVYTHTWASGYRHLGLGENVYKYVSFHMSGSLFCVCIPIHEHLGIGIWAGEKMGTSIFSHECAHSWFCLLVDFSRGEGELLLSQNEIFSQNPGFISLKWRQCEYLLNSSVRSSLCYDATVLLFPFTHRSLPLCHNSSRYPQCDQYNSGQLRQELNASNGCQLLSLEVYPHATLNTQFYIYSTQFYIYMVDLLISMRKISFPWQNPVKPLKIRGQSNLR